MWKVAEGTACQCMFVVFVSYLSWVSIPVCHNSCHVPFLYLMFPVKLGSSISSFFVMFGSCISRFPRCTVPVSRITRDVLFLYLTFPAMFGSCISRFPRCSVPVSRVSRDVLFLYLAFPAMFGSCISCFPPCSVPVSCVSRDVRSLYLAFHAMFGPCISRFPGCLFTVSRVSRDVRSLYFAFLVFFGPCMSCFPIFPVSRDGHNPLPPICTLSANKHCQTSCSGVCKVSFQACRLRCVFLREGRSSG